MVAAISQNADIRKKKADCCDGNNICMEARIKRAGLRRNMGVEMISEIAGISEATYYAIEKGTSTVS